MHNNVTSNLEVGQSVGYHCSSVNTSTLWHPSVSEDNGVLCPYNYVQSAEHKGCRHEKCIAFMCRHFQISSDRFSGVGGNRMQL